MNLVFRRPIIVTIFAMLSIATSSSAFVYVVKENDSLSIIAQKYFTGSVWGKNGSLSRILRSNPKIKNRNLIFPNDQIEITPSLPEVKNQAAELSSQKQDVVTKHESEIDSHLTLVKDTQDDGSMTSLEFIPSFSLTTLSATDSITKAKSIIASNLYISTDARFIQTWNDSFNSYLRAKLSYVSFEQPASGTKTLSSKSKLLTTFGVGGITKLSNRSKLQLSADLERNLFLRAASARSVVVDSVLTPSLGAQIAFDVVQMNSFKVNTAALYEHKFQANADSYRIKPGTSYGGTIGVSSKHNGEELFQVELSGLKRLQDTNVTSQSEILYTLSLKIPFSFGDPRTLK